MDLSGPLCEAIKTLGFPTCRLDGLYLIAIGGIATIALGILRPLLKKPFEDLKPTDALFVFVVSVVVLTVYFFHPAMRTPAAAIIGAIPLAVALAALLFPPLSGMTLPGPIALPLSKTAFGLVPIFLVVGGLVGSWLDQVRITSALFLLPPRQIDVGDPDDSLPERIFHPVRKALREAWRDAKPLAVLPEKAVVNFAEFSALQNEAETDYQAAFRNFGATDPVKYAVQSVLSVKDDRLSIRPDIIPLLGGRLGEGLPPTAGADVETRGPKKLSNLMALVAAYHLSRELTARETEAAADATQEQGVAQEQEIAKYFHEQLVAAFNEAREADSSLPDASDELKAELERTGCGEAACLAALVGRLNEWLDRQLTDPAKAAAGYSSIIAVTK